MTSKDVIRITEYSFDFYAFWRYVAQELWKSISRFCTFQRGVSNGHSTFTQECPNFKNLTIIRKGKVYNKHTVLVPHFQLQRNPGYSHFDRTCHKCSEKSLDWQGRNQVRSQKWARLENFPFPNFFPVEIFILGHPKQISVVSKSDKQKKKKVLAAHFHTFPILFKFSSSPFTTSLLFLSIFPSPHLLSLFPFLLFSPSPFHFSSFPPPLQNLP